METYFKPWRRKFGAFALAMACVLATAWVRSYSFQDWLFIQDIRFAATSAVGGIQWVWKYRFEVPGPTVEWMTARIEDVHSEYLTAEFDFPTVSYALIVIPLTAISAWLLLSPLRPPKGLSKHETKD